ncbi:IS200/IS605 family accessory protein TnpB-related protein [Caldinitratiruptor microaerophilus]|uniref:Uncharacterized protein n=1 Tax=Caldinitratiruptor microaerophilus TaxID=671077 RepID=A0AA35GAU6_9FIRM|nr:IS200/IS605 family accessory protein TnpB-related protein [Caldinitratiruptor microaerophilus]BDG61684.1 hypothetical protein caldi_27740 [Caldinitratiruptor microaerophilus]
MQVTFQTRLRDEALYPLLDAIAALYQRLQRRLFVDLYVRRRPVEECKREYIARHGLTARQFNAITYELKGKVRAAEETRQQRSRTLQGQIEATEKAIRKLQREDAALAKGSGQARKLPPHERVERRQRVRFRLHQKNRRLAMLRARLEAAENHQGPSSLCFGSRKLFRAQFHLAENGYASHDEWLQAWREARSDSFFCLGSKDETGGNQTCTLLPGGTLRLRVPNALAGEYGTHVLIRGVRFAYGQDVLGAALAAGQAISYRFVRKDGTWYLHATTERMPAPAVTHRQAGAVGVDLNPGLVAVAEIDRSGNPVGTRHIPVPIQGRRKEQVLATLGEAVADVVAWAKAAGKPVVVERLDFRAKKARLREVSDRHARRLSHFAYASFHALLIARAEREGVEVITVNPAFTSVIGKFMARYGLSPHAAAAVGDRPAGPEVWGAAPVRKRPSATCEESRAARLGRLAPGSPRRAWAEADACFIRVSLRGRPRQGGTPIRSGTGGCRLARPGAGWSGLGPGVRSPGANRREHRSPGVVS